MTGTPIEQSFDVHPEIARRDLDVSPTGVVRRVSDAGTLPIEPDSWPGQPEHEQYRQAVPYRVAP
jgi:hypothetical protein